MALLIRSAIIIARIKLLFQSVLNIVFGSAVRIGGIALGVISSIVLARVLGASDFGLYSMAMAWQAILLIPCYNGLDKIVVRELAKYRKQDDWGGIWSVVCAALLITSVIGACIFATASAGAYIILQDQILLLLTLPFDAVTTVVNSGVQGLNHVISSQIPVIIFRPIFMIGVILLACEGFNHTLSFTGVATIQVVTSITTCALSFFLFLKWMPQGVSASIGKMPLSLWLKDGLFMSIIGTIYLVNSRTDIVMLGMLDTSVATGVYAVVARISDLMLFFLQVNNIVEVPAYSMLISEGQYAALQKRVMLGAARVGLLTAIPFLVLIFAGPDVLRLWGNVFISGYNALWILCGAKLVSGMVGGMTLALLLNGDGKVLSWLILIGFCANIILNYLLIPLWGIEGAAIATSTSTIGWNIMAVWRFIRTMARSAKQRSPIDGGNIYEKA